MILHVLWDIKVYISMSAVRSESLWPSPIEPYKCTIKTVLTRAGDSVRTCDEIYADEEVKLA